MSKILFCIALLFSISSAFAAIDCSISKNGVVVDHAYRIDLGPFLTDTVSMKVSGGTATKLLRPAFACNSSDIGDKLVTECTITLTSLTDKVHTPVGNFVKTLATVGFAASAAAPTTLVYGDPHAGEDVLKVECIYRP